ncbi:hypothetical protein EDB86DRAFT_2889365 [Lactarius hatsudake]|nr:hypothetical protein EDB86DRAFT_2889365 [Lactarius hatsudake]
MMWTHVLLRSISNFIARSRPSGVTLVLLSAHGAWLGSGSVSLTRTAAWLGLGSGALVLRILFGVLVRYRLIISQARTPVRPFYPLIPFQFRAPEGPLLQTLNEREYARPQVARPKSKLTPRSRVGPHLKYVVSIDPFPSFPPPGVGVCHTAACRGDRACWQTPTPFFFRSSDLH